MPGSSGGGGGVVVTSGAPGPLSIAPVHTGSFTLTASDMQKWHIVDTADPVDINVPNNSVTALPVGSYFYAERLGAGAPNVKGATGVSFRYLLGTGSGDFQVLSKVALVKVAANVWSVTGHIEQGTDGGDDPGTFDMTSLSNLQGWWKQEGLAGYAGAAAVTSWADSSGAARTLAQATGTNQPTCSATGIGGGKGVLFDGVNDYLTLGAQTVIANATGAWLIMAIKPQGAQVECDDFALQIVTEGTTRLVQRRNWFGTNNINAGGRRTDADSFGYVTSADSVLAAGTAYITSIVLNYATATAKAYVNGTQVATGAFQTTGNSSNTAVNIHMGANSPENGIYSNVIIGEAALLAQAPSDGDREEAEAYFADKFSVTF